MPAPTELAHEVPLIMMLWRNLDFTALTRMLQAASNRVAAENPPAAKTAATDHAVVIKTPKTPAA